MRITISFATITQGNGKKRAGSPLLSRKKRKQNVINLDDYCRVTRFISVLPPDRLCLVKAIVIAIAHKEGEKNAKNLKNQAPQKLALRVNKIVDALNLPRNEALNLTHLKQIEDYLEDYCIVVYCGGERNQAPIYWNKNYKTKKFIYILHQDDHFDPIIKITVFFNVRKIFCKVFFFIFLLKKTCI
jgi:hypothetical protein